jgi:hypothetical protein
MCVFGRPVSWAPVKQAGQRRLQMLVASTVSLIGLLKSRVCLRASCQRLR